jgi:hypothetical protein
MLRPTGYIMILESIRLTSKPSLAHNKPRCPTASLLIASLKHNLRYSFIVCTPQNPSQPEASIAPATSCHAVDHYCPRKPKLWAQLKQSL